MDINFNSYRSDVNKPNSSDSDSTDSESNQDVWKRCTAKSNSTHPALLTSENCEQNEGNSENQCMSNTSTVDVKRKKNTIWSNVLQERSVAEDLTQIGLKAKPILFHDRSCENYDYTLKYQDPREIEECVIEDDIISDSEINATRTLSKTYLSCKSRHKIELRKRKKEFLEVAKKIIRVLNEPKHSLIYKVVETIGCAKAMDILKETESIEENGGMYVKDNSRRRTPGGTYLTLVREDKSISKKKRTIIFEDDRRIHEKRLKLMKRAKYNEKKRSAVNSKKNSSGKVKNDIESVNVAENVSMEVSEPYEVVPSKEDSDVEEGEIVD